jgi:hypothetical protein
MKLSNHSRLGEHPNYVNLLKIRNIVVQASCLLPATSEQDARTTFVKLDYNILLQVMLKRIYVCYLICN